MTEKYRFPATAGHNGIQRDINYVQSSSSLVEIIEQFQSAPSTTKEQTKQENSEKKIPRISVSLSVYTHLQECPFLFQILFLFEDHRLENIISFLQTKFW